MDADLDTLLTALYVEVDDHIIAGRREPGRPRCLPDADLACLAVAPVLLARLPAEPPVFTGRGDDLAVLAGLLDTRRLHLS